MRDWEYQFSGTRGSNPFFFAKFSKNFLLSTGFLFPGAKTNNKIKGRLKIKKKYFFKINEKRIVEKEKKQKKKKRRKQRNKKRKGNVQWSKRSSSMPISGKRSIRAFEILFS